ncbi:MAG: hypothetical protein KF833_12225 [Verrucomicrobiae bacterium]|nr:hypothetical protein [Verrucomicrobiae bacterium]
MDANAVTTHFSALAAGDLAVVRVDGPGVCRECGRFENLLLDIEKRGFASILLDLSSCGRVDSTFAGVLLRLAERINRRPPGAKPLQVAVTGANRSIIELLDTLCLDDLFDRVDLPPAPDLAPLDIADRDRSKEEIMALSLDGHERLAALNDENARRFAQLLPLLRQELARAGQRRAGQPDPADS